LQLRRLKSVLISAQKIVLSNDVPIRKIVAKFPDIEREKFCSVAHIGTSSSERDFSQPQIWHHAGRFVHVGRLTRERACQELVAAIRDLVGSERGERGRFPGFTFVGWVDPAFRESCRELERCGAIEFLGDVDPEIAQSICKAASVLVVIEAKMPESPFLPSKFCDYAMLGKPILSISPPGPIRNYLSRYGGGLAIGHDVLEIQNAMRALVESGQATSDTSELAAEFSAHRVAEAYLKIFGLRP
jgi:glycosyltransferase involved in cell wall biosynthesis